jgi:glutamate-1-semialdehyde 2,1-aminomutase
MDDRSVETYLSGTPRSRELSERAAEVMPGGDTRSVTYHDPYPSFVASASGCRLVTEDGEELVDFLNNYTQSVLGHAPPAVVEAVTERFGRGNGLGAPTEDAVELAERLVDRVPSLEQVRFGNSGTEATMNAIRGAMAHTGNETVLKIHGGYHGTHDTVEVAVDSAGREHRGIPADVETRVRTTPFNDGEALKTVFAEAGDDLACFILEPVLGVGGAIPAETEFLQTARDLTRNHEVPLVFDEVMTFRLGYGGAQERYGVTPDLTALGKCIGGGLPVGAFGGRADIMSAFDPKSGDIAHSGTFNANPATMAGGVATLETLDRATIERLNDLGSQLRSGVRDVLAGHGRSIRVTGEGSMFQLHVTGGQVTDARSGNPGRDAFGDLFMALRNRGIFIAPRGMGNLSTPMTGSEIEEFLDALDASLSFLAGRVS